jgi:hypothetical protein
MFLVEIPAQVFLGEWIIESETNATRSTWSTTPNLAKRCPSTRRGPKNSTKCSRTFLLTSHSGLVSLWDSKDVLEFFQDLGTFMVISHFLHISSNISMLAQLSDLVNKVIIFELWTMDQVPLSIHIHYMSQIMGLVPTSLEVSDGLWLHCECLKESFQPIGVIN